MTRRTKILATLGPATDTQEKIEAIIAAGANVVRMNFSHGQAEDHIERAKRVRAAAAKLGKYVAILGDLQGPKIRVSRFANDKVFLNEGDPFVLDAELDRDAGNEQQVGIDYKALPDDVSTGDILLLDDGRIQLEVTGVDGRKVLTKVTVGGKLSNNKGINRLGGGLSAEALTEKDKRDILTAAEIGVDYLAVSFPRSGADLNYARELAEAAGCKAKICAKVERAEAVATDEAIDDIISASDAVMVARGDLGVEIGDAELVGVQKKLIARSRQLNKVVITATQMMESMIESPMPTRAEVTDVATAVDEQVDAIMLSGETATGKHPARCVEVLDRIARRIEKAENLGFYKQRKPVSLRDHLARSACRLADSLNAPAVIVITQRGVLGQLVSSFRPQTAIVYAFTNSSTAHRQLWLCHSVVPFKMDLSDDPDETLAAAFHRLRSHDRLVPGDPVVVVSDVVTRDGNVTAIQVRTVR